MLRILLLDDDPIFNSSLTQSLQQNALFKCQVVAVTNENDAYEKVQQAAQPFDIFLIDQQLGPMVDGIEVLQRLLHLSPESEAIVFTVAGDGASRKQSYQAGAYTSLHKPFSVDDLLLIIKSLCEWRITRNEWAWLNVINEIAEAAQQLLPLQEMSRIIVTSGQKLGFQRVRLWLLDATRDTLIGVNEAGNNGLEQFKDFELPVEESPYVKLALAERSLYIFHGQEFGASYLHRSFAAHGYQPATGDWVGLPLWVGDRCLGLLLLDNHSKAHHINAQHCEQLKLFSKQVAAAVERALLFEQEQRIDKKLKVLTEIGHHISVRAPVVLLDQLIAEVRAYLGHLMNVDHFCLALKDHASQQIDLRLFVEDDAVGLPRTIPAGVGLTGYLIEHNAPLLLPTRADIHAFGQAHQISPKQIGEPALCWLGVPLQLQSRAIGAIVVQSIDREHAYDAADQQLLVAVAGQIAGALQMARLKDKADQTSRRLMMLQQLSEKLLELAEDREEWLWHATLTAITANYVLGFNRAALFLLGDDTRLHGTFGIGHLDPRLARAAWAHDLKNGMSLETYLRQLTSSGFPPTPVHEAVCRLTFDASDDESAFGEALRTFKSVIVREHEAPDRLPPALIKTLGSTEYAVFPLYVGNTRLGLIIADNMYNHIPVLSMPLDVVETLLAQVALIYENVRQRQASQRLINVSTSALAQVADQALQITLTQICEAALVIARADCVALYPLTKDPGQSKPRLDLQCAGFAGLQHDLRGSEPPRLMDTTMERLQGGETIPVSNIAHEAHLVKSLFLKREGIKAFIAVPIQDQETKELTGILYLNYRTTQSFHEADLSRANSIAALAGAAIHTKRAGDLVDRSRKAHEFELDTLNKVMEWAITESPHTQHGEDGLIRLLLQSASSLLSQPDARIGLLLRKWDRPIEGKDPEEFRQQYFLSGDNLDSFPERRFHHGITGLAFRTGEDRNVPDVTAPEWEGVYYVERAPGNGTRSELDVLIRLQGHSLGLFNIESPRVGAFGEADLKSIRRLADAAGLALDTLRRQRNIRKLRELAEKKPSDLDETFAAVQDVVLAVAPGIAALTLWYKKPRSTEAELWRGHFGVRHPDRIRDAPAEHKSPVWAVMQTGTPIFESKIDPHSWLAGQFVRDEEIVSVAGLPLKVDDEIFGALFFNYRHQPHEFTSEEQVLFSVLASMAAARIRDAMRLDDLKREREHLREALDRLAAAMQITTAVGTALNLHDTLEKIMSELHKLFPNTRLCVLTYEAQIRKLRFTKASEHFYNPEYMEKVRDLDIYGTKSIACRIARIALKHKRPVAYTTKNVQDDPNYLEANSSTRSQLSLAFMSANREHLLGVLILESDQLDAFKQKDVELVSAVGQAISIVIERAYTIKELQFKTLAATAMSWASEIVHDVKNEIGVALYTIDLLRGNQLSSQDNEQWEQIQKSLKRVAETANSPQLDVMEELEIDSWLNKYIKPKIERIIEGERRNIKVRVLSACPKLHVRASLMMLERAIHHLMRNALEAMEDAGQLIFQTRNIDDQMLEIQVIDTGPGVPEDKQDILLHDLFSTKEREPGNRGRGLIITRIIVEAMGGKLYLLPPEHPPGAVFAFRLPIIQPQDVMEVTYEFGE